MGRFSDDRLVEDRQLANDYGANDLRGSIRREQAATPVDLSQGIKHDEDKPRFDLLSPQFLLGTSQVLTFGAEKYKDWNWAKGIKYSRVFGALQRHLWAYWAGEDLDEETRMPHLWHASCCLMFLVHYEACEADYDHLNDRPDFDKMVPNE